MPDAVEIAQLCKTYRTGYGLRRRQVRAVDKLSLSIPRGEIFGLLGPNGAGKTTTIKMLAGLIDPDSGSIRFPAWGRRPPLGAVLEGSRNLYWRLSAWENIRYFGEVKGVAMSQLKRQAEELLALFGIADKRDAAAQTLSRGQQQKLAVVLAFLGDPQLLLLDEPTLGLDVASSLAIQRLLKQLCQERGLTIVITTHQMDVAQALCRRVGIMNEGRVAVCAPVDELVDHFRRQDYTVRLDAAAWARVEAELSGFAQERLPEERPGQVNVRFKLARAQELYPLVDVFARHGVELLDFRQEVPTLGEIFVSVTGAAGGQA
jgi:ABC-2 type transport system ATP-binding protein